MVFFVNKTWELYKILISCISSSKHFLQTSKPFKSLQYFTISKRLRLWNLKLPILDGVRVLRPSLASSIGISSGQAQMPCRQPDGCLLNCRCFHIHLGCHIISLHRHFSHQIILQPALSILAFFASLSDMFPALVGRMAQNFLNQSDFGQVLNQKFTLHTILHCLPSFQLQLDTLTAARASHEDQGPWKSNILSQFISKSQFQ